jgi:protein-S-isoprenylcysteine O-methyltransferase Ste14
MSILIVFSTLVLGRIVHLRYKYRTSALSIIRNKGMQRILGIAAVTIINVWVAILLTYILHPEIKFLPYPLNLILFDLLPVKILGVSLIIFGMSMYIAAWIALSNYWRIGQDSGYQGELIRKGVYGISRNPMYLFYDLYFIGTFLINGVLIFLVLAILLIVTLHYLIIQEEKFLDLTYGEYFRTYSCQTRRYVTWKSLQLMK